MSLRLLPAILCALDTGHVDAIHSKVIIIVDAET